MGTNTLLGSGLEVIYVNVLAEKLSAFCPCLKIIVGDQVQIIDLFGKGNL